MRRLLSTATMCLALAGSALPAMAAVVTPPRTSLGVSTNISLPSSITEIEFIDAAGNKHHLNELSETTLLVPFLTLCPEVCPFTTGNAIQVARLLKARNVRHVRVVEVTVDPARDTVRRLAAYRKMVGLTKNDTMISHWRASAKDTSTFMKFFGMTTERMKASADMRDWWTDRPLAYDLDHSDGFYVLSRKHHLRYISGLSPRFVGNLTKAMKSFLSDDGLTTLSHPLKGWTPKDAIAALSYVADRPF